MSKKRKAANIHVYINNCIHKLLKEHNIATPIGATQAEHILLICSCLSIEIPKDIAAKPSFTHLYLSRSNPLIDKFYHDTPKQKQGKSLDKTPFLEEDKFIDSQAQADKLQVARVFRAKLIKKITRAEKHFLILLVDLKKKCPTLAFSFQHPWIEDDDFYFSDFFFEPNFTIEIDGGYHSDPNQRKKDFKKAENLRKRNIRTYRISNENALKMTEKTVLSLLIDKNVFHPQK